jgi:hypothetical protein
VEECGNGLAKREEDKMIKMILMIPNPKFAFAKQEGKGSAKQLLYLIYAFMFSTGYYEGTPLSSLPC